MKLEETLAKSAADLASSCSMHSRDISAATDSIARSQLQITQLQEQLDAAAARAEALGSEVAAAAEAQQLSATQVRMCISCCG